MAYPPEPWSLRGRMHVSLWLVPRTALPALPAGLPVRVVRIGRRAVLGTAWVDYRPGGDMTYRELLCATLVRAGARPRVTITHIWVDSADSRDGGRALWGIPKDLAELTVTGEHATAVIAAGPVAAAGLGRGVRLPVRLPAVFRVVQLLAGGPRTTPVRASARYGPARVRWRIEPGGPLGFLAAHRPLLSLVADDFRMRFGTPPPRQGQATR